MADTWRLTASQARTIGKPQFAGKIRICLAHFRPEVICLGRSDQDQYEGYQVALFEQVALALPWLGGTDAWFFDCIPWEELMRDINSPNGTCLIAPTRVLSSEARRLSWVVDKEGLKILVKAKREVPWAPFSPFEAFSIHLWVTLAATAVFVGACIWFFDVAVKSIKRTYDPHKKHDGDDLSALRGAPASVVGHGGAVSGAAPGANGTPDALAAVAAPAAEKDCERGEGGGNAAIGKAGEGGGNKSGDEKDEEPKTPSGNWFLKPLGVRKGEESKVVTDLDMQMRRSLLRIARINDPPHMLSLPSQIILFAYGLLITIIVSMYTGGTAARLTAIQLTGGINGLEDLPGKVVGTWKAYVGRLRDNGIVAIGLPWLSFENSEKMLSELRGGDIDALVLDRNFIDNTAATDCDFVAVGTPFSLADVGYGLALNMQEPLERDLNRVIRDLIQSGVTEKLRNTLILRAADTTKCRQVQVQLNNQVKLDQVAGLWVMLAIALMFALLALGIFWLRRRRAVQWLVLNGLPSGAQLVSSKVFGGSRERLASLRSAASAGGVKGGRGERELSERRKDRSGGDAFD